MTRPSATRPPVGQPNVLTESPQLGPRLFSPVDDPPIVPVTAAPGRQPPTAVASNPRAHPNPPASKPHYPFTQPLIPSLIATTASLRWIRVERRKHERGFRAGNGPDTARVDGKAEMLPRIGRVEMVEHLRFSGSIREVAINQTAGTGSPASTWRMASRSHRSRTDRRSASTLELALWRCVPTV